MRYLLKYFEKKDKLLLALTYSITIVWVAINSSQWFLIAKLTDIFFLIQESNSISYQESVQYALYLFAFLIGLNIVGFSLKFLTRSLSVKISLTLSFKIRNKAYYEFLFLKEKEINEIGISSLNNRLTNDINELQYALLNMFTFAFERILILVFCIIYSIILSPILSTIYPLIILIVGLFAYIAGIKSFNYYEKANKSLDGTNRIMRENITGNKIIRIFGLQKQQAMRFHKYNNVWFKSILNGENIVYMIFVFIMFIINSLNIFLLIIGGVVNYNAYFFGNNFPIQAISIGVIVGFVNYLWETIFAIAGMLEVYVSYARVRPIIKRIMQILKAKKEMINLNENIKKMNQYEIKFENVNFKYNDDKQNILQNINVTLKQNKVYGLIGPTGSGKSSFINLICKLYEPNSGHIKINNIDYNKLSESEVRKNISIAFQEKLIYQGTFKSNVLIAKKDASEKELIKVLKQSQAFEFINKLNKKWDDFVAEKGSNLSGGQKQRLSLARAFIKDCNILILDDSLSALDNITRNKIIKTLKNDFKNKTIIISGQQIKTISFADEIIVFDKGKIKASGTHKQLLKKCNLYKKIYDSQKTIGE